jgi:hypothetical protein
MHRLPTAAVLNAGGPFAPTSFPLNNFSLFLFTRRVVPFGGRHFFVPSTISISSLLNPYNSYTASLSAIVRALYARQFLATGGINLAVETFALDFWRDLLTIGLAKV